MTDVTIRPAGRRGRPPAHWADLEAQEQLSLITDLGWPKFRARQVDRHYNQFSATPQGWTDLPAAERERLSGHFPELLTPIRTRSADSGATRKHVWQLHDGSLVESVVMGYPDRATACISSQAGCGMACPFCATGQEGLTRNLSAAEIIEQARLAHLEAADLGLGKGRLSNVVFMGMGEPLANYRAVMRAVRRIVSGFGISARSVTVSTVGLVPGIRRLAEEGLPVTLAVSLHAPDDELRDTLVPVNQRFPVAEVMAAADDYVVATGRRYSIEYALIKDINDQPERARMLADLLSGRIAHVNLIPLNPTPGSVWTATSAQRTEQFIRILRDGGVSTTLRDTRGSDIDGACGQLAAETA
ncbi:MAG: 23S rRNA (adenine(2503)-C(2))-methyltransferase RlmN [Actinobacteria bacterium]|nr:23S rRNA (adenine(2503)-C(2))-methyltransferase RlmN [Actinomycetota bacterium]